MSYFSTLHNFSTRDEADSTLMDGFHGRGSQLIHPTEQHADSKDIPGVGEKEEEWVVELVVGGTNPEGIR